jgi:prepilin-type N-terminal cleavage/methylation domain-containing protein
MQTRRGFTLIELLIVIGIVAVLAVVVIITLNPAELLKQARDSNRLSDLDTLNKALSIVEAEVANASFGTSTTVYVSIPDSSPTCANLGLPSLPTGYAYGCAPTSTLRNTDGTGWVPVNFGFISSGSPLSALPVDPTNTSSTGRYYIYTPGGSWELNAILESQKYKYVSAAKQNLPGIVAIGSNLTLSPIANTAGLVGYWPFNEGTGTSAADASGSGNNGSFSGSPTWQTNCKVGVCLNFPSGTHTVTVPHNSSISLSNSLTITAWIKMNSLPVGSPHPIYKGPAGGTSANYHWYFCGNACGSNNVFRWYAGAGGSWQQISGASPTLSTGTWNLMSITYTTSGGRLYWNGVAVGSLTASGALGTNTSNLSIGNDGISGADFVMDDVRIYNRALSAAEIAAIYNATQ